MVDFDVIGRLREELVRREPRILRSTKVTRVTFGRPAEGRIPVRVVWPGGELTTQVVLADHLRVDVGKIRHPCYIAQQLIKEILQARGV